MVSGCNHRRGLASQKFWDQSCRIQRLLRHVVDREDTEDHSVAVVGSAAVIWYCDKERLGSSYWEPTTVSIAVCGKYGQGIEAFAEFISRTKRRMHFLGHDIQIYLYEVSTRSCCGDCRVCTISLSAIDLKFQFLQAPVDQVEDFVKDFPVDVSKVVYYIHTCECVPLNKVVELHLKQGRAEVSSIEFDHTWVTCAERSMVMFAIAEIRKYQGRGFNFINAAGIIFHAPYKSNAED